METLAEAEGLERSPSLAQAAVAEAGSSPVAATVNEGLLVLLLAAVQFANVLDFMLLMPLGPSLQKALHISPAQFGLIISSYTFSACFGGLLAALVIDKFDRKRALLILVSGFTIGTFACGLSNTYETLLVARVATGAFGGVLGALIFAIIGDVFPADRRGEATGKVVRAFAVASVAGLPFGLFLGERYGWQSPFYLLGLLGVLVGVAAAVGLPSLRGHMGRSSGRNPAVELWSLIVEPNHMRAFALMTAIMIGSFAVFPYLSDAMVSNGGLTDRDLKWLYVAGGVCAYFSAPMIGRLADRIGKLPVYWIMAVLMIFPVLAATNVRPIPLWVGMLLYAAVMVFSSGRMVPAVAMITGSVEPRRRGGFMSVNSAVQHLAMTLGAFTASRMIDRDASGHLTGYAMVGVLAVVATLVSLPLAARLRPAPGGRIAVDGAAAHA